MEACCGDRPAPRGAHCDAPGQFCQYRHSPHAEAEESVCHFLIQRIQKQYYSIVRTFFFFFFGHSKAVVTTLLYANMFKKKRFRLTLLGACCGHWTPTSGVSFLIALVSRVTFMHLFITVQSDVNSFPNSYACYLPRLNPCKHLSLTCGDAQS